MGSDAEYIVRNSPVPVLLLRGRSEDYRAQIAGDTLSGKWHLERRPMSIS